MNHTKELNSLIDIARQASGFQRLAFQPKKGEDQPQLEAALKSNNVFLTTSVLGMEAVSHVIENEALRLNAEFSLYTGCQKLSYLVPQMERYKKLCELGRPINVYCITDSPTWNYPNLNIAPLVSPTFLNEDSMANNWFVVLKNPNLVSIALLAREIPNSRPPLSPTDGPRVLYRNFEGFWTYDRTIINKICGILDHYTGQLQRSNSIKDWR